MPNTEDKKMNILQACIQVFSQKGYHSSTIEDIANEAGIGKGTVYLYFTSKKDLFEEMISYSLNKYIYGIEDVLSKNISVEERLLKLSEFHKKYLIEHINLAQSMFGQATPISSEEMKVLASEKREKIKSILNNFIEDGILKGEIRKDINKDIAGMSILATISQYYVDSLNYGESNIDDNQLVQYLLKSIS